MITDLTTGKPSRVLVGYTLPLFGSVIFQQLYNIADSVIAGRFAGEAALAAVGASFPITAIYTAFAVGLNVGASVIISRLFGAKLLREMKTAVSTACVLSAVLCLLLTVLGTVFSSAMLRMLSTPAEVFAPAADYLRVYTAGITFVFFYNVITGVFTALGDSRTPFYFLVASSVGNVVLDLAFVHAFPADQKVAGLAWATFAAQGVACICAAIALVRRLSAIECGERADFFSVSLMGKIAFLAVPSILQNSFVSVGNLLIQALVNDYGASVIAGYSAAVKVSTFAITSFSALSNAISAYTSQNFGAGKLERVGQGYRACLAIGFAVALPFMVCYLFFGGGVMMLFSDGATSAVGVGRDFLRTLAAFYPVVAVKLISDGVLRGGGDVVGFTAATFVDLIFRVAFAYLFHALFHSDAALWWSWPAGWILGTAVSVGFYASGRWKKRLLI